MKARAIKKVGKKDWKCLYIGEVHANKNHPTGTVPGNKDYPTGSVSLRKTRLI